MPPKGTDDRQIKEWLGRARRILRRNRRRLALAALLFRLISDVIDHLHR